MPQDDWAAFNPQSAGAPAAQRPILGPPPKVDPYRDAAEGRAQNNDRRAAEDQARQQAQWDASHNPDGSEKPKVVTDGKPTEYQSKSAGFLGRMLQAESFYHDVPDDSKDPRAYLGQTLHDWAPNVENTLPTWMGGNSGDRQSSDQAAENFIAASLRQESGASIAPSEYDRQYRIFYPSPGDTPEQLDQKSLARKQAIEGFRIAAGGMANDIINTTVGTEYRRRVERGDSADKIVKWLETINQKADPGQIKAAVEFRRTHPEAPLDAYSFKAAAPANAPQQPQPAAEAAPQAGNPKRLKYNPATGKLE